MLLVRNKSLPCSTVPQSERNFLYSMSPFGYQFPSPVGIIFLILGAVERKVCNSGLNAEHDEKKSNSCPSCPYHAKPLETSQKPSRIIACFLNIFPQMLLRLKEMASVVGVVDVLKRLSSRKSQSQKPCVQ